MKNNRLFGVKDDFSYVLFTLSQKHCQSWAKKGAGGLNWKKVFSEFAASGMSSKTNFDRICIRITEEQLTNK